MEKCKKLTRINPDANLFICPILPTRDYEMNKRAIFMNHRIQVLAESCFKINVFDCNAFIDQVGLLQHRLCSKPETTNKQNKQNIFNRNVYKY